MKFLLWLSTSSLLVLASVPSLAVTSLSPGAKAETDIYTIRGEGPEHLLDTDSKSHFLLHRVLDSEWRITFAGPARVQQLVLVQGYQNWSLPEELILESADGTQATLPLKTDTRNPQTFTLDFPRPTAFIDVRISKAKLSDDGKTFGGMAEMRFEGDLEGSDLQGPQISDIRVEKRSSQEAIIHFTTDEPTSSRIRFSHEDAVSTLTPQTLGLSQQHDIPLTATSPLGGQIEIRCADAAGNRTELRYDAFTTINTEFQWGMGGWAFKFGEKWQKASERYKEDGLAIQFAQAWTADNNWRDYLKSVNVRELNDEGFLPEIIHFYLGYVTQAKVHDVREKYLQDVSDLAAVLKESGVGERVLVTLEPEYNQGDVIEWDGWNDLMIEAIQILHQGANAKVGLLPGPWDIGHRVPLSMGRAAAHADFVALQSMAGSVTNTREEMRERVNETLQFTRYLNRRFLRPVRLGYLMISDFGGWSDVQRDVMIEYCERQKELQSAGLVSIAWMGYTDSPGADGALGEAEAHKGLRYADGGAKPAFEVFKECALHGASWVASGQEPPGKDLLDQIQARSSESGCACRVESAGGDGRISLFGLVLGALGLIRRARRTRSRQ